MLSERIVDGRPYKTWEDLEEVEGIGRIRLKKLKEFSLDPGEWKTNKDETGETEKTDNDE